MQQPSQLPLRDIKMPLEPDFWPLAAGWWVLIAVALLCLLMGLTWAYKKHKIKRHFSRINQQLMAVYSSFQVHQSKHRLAAETSEFLRRFVKHQMNNQEAVTLTGSAWLDFLNASIDGQHSTIEQRKDFSEFEQALIKGPYSPDIDFDAEQLIQQVRVFCQRNTRRAHA